MRLVVSGVRWSVDYALLRSFSVTAPTALARSRLDGPWRTPPEGRALRPMTIVWSQADMVIKEWEDERHRLWRDTMTQYVGNFHHVLRIY